MRRTVLLLIAAFTLLGCGDDAVKPGGLLVRWTQGPLATCGSRHLVKVEARAYLKDVLQNTAFSGCPAAERSGGLNIEELPPGTYKVIVEGFDADDKGIYLGAVDKVAVKEGKSTTTAEIELTQKPVRLNVLWTTPTGRCAGSPIEDVEVNVYVNATSNTTLAANLEGVCEAESTDPDDPSNQLAGLLFEGIEPNDDVIVIAYGLSAAGAKIAKGQTAAFILSPGDFVTKDVTLTTCPGTPPVCD